jgi:hypothetical protein
MLKPEEIELEAKAVGGALEMFFQGDPNKLVELFARRIEHRVLQRLDDIGLAKEEMAAYRRKLGVDPMPPTFYCTCCGQRKGP